MVSSSPISHLPSSMSSIVIKAENLGKMYTIGHQAEKVDNTLFRDVLMQNARSLWHKIKDLATGKPIIQGDTLEEVWALKDVNFEINRGEAVGIIGRNGAGKSTLLKILSRITEPSTGRVTIKGRVASLLEVGTGFHPELSGRENIYLNGTILGMTRAEIKGKFDEIVAFAEVEKFLDTPVKRYSSGMYVRLAFAVAAHIEPEILVVDEVLAVGDAAFQKKCLGKMGEVAHEGRTVLFVSHNMAAITQLCSKTMLVENGKIQTYGTTDEIVRKYLTISDTKQCKVDLINCQPRCGTGEVVFESARLQNILNDCCRDFSIGDEICIVFRIKACNYYVNKKIKLAVQLRSSDGLPLCNMIDVDSGFQVEGLQEQRTVSVRIADVRLYPDTYFVSLWAGSITSTETFDHVVDCLSFDIVDGGKLTSRRLPRSAGLLFMTPKWQMTRDE
jgi:lipopolysaccharide transport system ATP-binding protein